MLTWVRSALSAEQREPLEQRTQQTNIRASAGSGKTRTLTHLLAADLATGIPAPGIVAFTFTEKAAEELLARIHVLAKRHLPDVNLSGLYVGTIHAWCLQYLVQQSTFYGFSPIDELQLDVLVSRLYDVLGLEEAYGQPYPRAIERFLRDLEVFYNEHLSLDDVPDKIEPCIRRLLAILERSRLLTFGDMIRRATDYLGSQGPVPGLQSLYVDEYQDVNPAQVELIKCMTGPHSKLLVVGDELQCIYNWRGSDVARILAFPVDFPDASVFRLTNNYRSRPGIVAVANTFAETVSLRDPGKVMAAHRSSANCKVVQLLSLDSEDEQVQAIVQIVRRYRAEGVPWKAIAVLLRSVVKWGKPIVDGLAARDIPVQCPIVNQGGPFIKEFLLPVLNWLRSEHPEPKSEADEARIEQQANQLWEAVRHWIPSDKGETTFWQALNVWLDAIEEQRNEAYNVRDRLYDFLDMCGVRIAPGSHNLMVGLGIASQIIRSVEEVHRRRLEAQPRRTPRGITSETYFALSRNQDDFGESVPIDTAVDAVVVTTVHQAKGLEWPIVIIPTLAKGRFPVRSRGHQSSYADDIAGRYGTSEEDERRLLYVAMTRARERLFLLEPVRRTSEARSMFMQELEDRGALTRSEIAAMDAPVWRLHSVDLKQSDPPPLRVALSDLLLYLECPYQYGLRRIAGVRPAVGDELGYGKGLHELIRRRCDAEEQWDSQQLAGQVEQHVNLPLMSEDGERVARRAIESRMRALEQLGAFVDRAESEVALELLLEAGIVHGVVDNLHRNADNLVLIRDWKSSIHERLLPRYERQLQCYAYALRLQDVGVDSAEIVDVAASTQQGRLVARAVDVSHTTLTALVCDLNGALRGIAERDFSPRPGPGSCSCCDTYRVCSGRYAHDLRQHD